MLLLAVLYLVSQHVASLTEQSDAAKAVVKVASKLTGACPPVNNIPEENVCWLRFSQISFAGSHNSGAGDGMRVKIPFLGDKAAPSCRLQNQKLTITQQLELGVRAFDFDVAYQQQASSSSKDRAVIFHCAAVCAYGKTLMTVLTEITEFLEENSSEILVIRIKDYKAGTETEELLLTKVILAVIEDTIGSSRLNYHTDPLVASALILKRPVFFYLHTDLWLKIKHVKYSLRYMKKYLRPNKNLETWYQLHEDVNLSCDLKEESLEYFEDEEVKMVMRNYTWLPIVSDWYAAGLQIGTSVCLDEQSDACQDTMSDNILIAQHLQNKFNRTINVLMTDYTGVDTLETVNKLNKQNIQHFVVEKQGPLEMKISHSHHMTKYPFEVPKRLARAADEEKDD